MHFHSTQRMVQSHLKRINFNIQANILERGNISLRGSFEVNLKSFKTVVLPFEIRSNLAQLEVSEKALGLCIEHA